MSTIQVQLLDTNMPQSVPCANCGKQAHLGDYAFDGEYHVDDDGVHTTEPICLLRR